MDSIVIFKNYLKIRVQNEGGIGYFQVKFSWKLQNICLYALYQTKNKHKHRMKYGSPRQSFRLAKEQTQQQLDKTQSKFNRKQVLPKEGKRKQKNENDDQRICFMSPDRINMLVTSKQSSFTSPQSSSNIYSSPQFPQEESFIHNLNNDTSEKMMNDSLLSIYNELNLEKEEEINSLKGEIHQLNKKIDKLRQNETNLKGREEEMEYLQEYLIKRQTDICEIHQKNAQLKEQIVKLSKEKEMALKQGEYLKKLFEKERQKYISEIKSLKKQIERITSENQKKQQQNSDLKQEIEKIQSKTSRNFLRQHSLLQIQRNQIDSSPDENIESPTKIDMASSLKLKNIKVEESPSRRSYHQLLSSRSSKIIKKSSEDDQDFVKGSNISQRRCGCKAIIQSLHQKIRYNEIQIDILKRVKAKGESFKSENQRLKKQNSSLLNRIEYLSERRQKKPIRRKDSGSSLELSLSPSQKNRKF